MLAAAVLEGPAGLWSRATCSQLWRAASCFARSSSSTSHSQPSAPLSTSESAAFNAALPRLSTSQAHHHCPPQRASEQQQAGCLSAVRRAVLQPHQTSLGSSTPINPWSSPPSQAYRMASTQPENAIYTGPSPPSPRRVTLRTLRAKYQQGTPISMATAYDYPSAVHVDQANIDILLVGDSVAMVVHGHDTTLPVTLEEMLMHCRAVARGARRSFLIGDLPFGSYETNVRDAVVSATRLLKEGQMDAVKLEGGSPARVEAAHAIVEAGVAVMGHVGLTPQSVSVIGGFRPQAQVAEEALTVIEQAQALQRAGCFALVLECVPGPIAAAITKSVGIPTIGIGAGPSTSGQVLVYHDLLGMMSHPHHAKVTPKFCKSYAQVGKDIQIALQQYREEVTSRQFPSPQHTPYRIPQAEVEALAAALRGRGSQGAAAAQAVEEAAGWEVSGS